MESSQAFPETVEHICIVTYNPRISFLDTDSREKKTFGHTNSYTQMPIAALFIIVKTRK